MNSSHDSLFPDQHFLVALFGLCSSAGLEIVRRPSLFGKALLMELGSWLLDFACVLAALQPFGVAAELGLAVGLLYHMAQVLPIAALALIDSRFVARR